MQTAKLRAAPVRRIYSVSTPQRRRIQTRQSQCFTDAPRPSQAEVDKARAYCAHLVRTYDTPSHILQSFIPHASRDAYLAIRAFNVDVARVADTTSTPTIGMMRMQFWRDAVTKALAGSPPKEPVAILLAHAAESLHTRTDGRSRLSKNWFHRIINTREQHLANPPYPTLQALESYAENTYSTLMYLTLSALPQASITTDHIASHIGKATGIAAVLRGVPLVAFPQPAPAGTAGHITGQSGPTQGAVLLPLDVMAEANVKEEDVFRMGGAAPGLQDAVFAVATRANDHLITARDMLAKLRAEGSLGHDFEHQHDGEHSYGAEQLGAGKEQQLAEVEQAFGVFVASVATQSWLDRLQQANFDLFDPGLRKNDWKLPAKAYWAYTRRRL
ncbi:Squalene/phytoene synthase-domain-containing protein [Boeremia exigua]|uniref:Squalene/phytoene synthase-domain-containing protein n=1 Tax=Boeremia exigua TaxID=749465 RepID=UPI001E8D7B34|nr:Squalene/phytoene synthase-domain-containing protein [Boeremia exigua]KAH6642129.1 Squalene/phytoene synthase-domain-containing protein [Boeremia exigua]